MNKVPVSVVLLAHNEAEVIEEVVLDFLEKIVKKSPNSEIIIAEDGSIDGTKEILQRNRIVIDVNEKVNELDQVVVTPENQEKFLDLKEEEFKRFDYSFDKSTRVNNVINEHISVFLIFCF